MPTIRNIKDLKLYGKPTADADFFASAQRQPEIAKPKKNTGLGGFLTSLISEAGGTGGAIAGQIAIPIPGVGAAIGGGIGSFLGRLVENKVRDDEYRPADALKEGALTGLFAGGPIKLLKGGAAATKALATGEKALPAFEKAASGGLFGKLTGKGGNTLAKDIDMASSGLEPGTAMKGGRFLNPDRADELYEFGRKASQKYGVRVTPGKPIKQARDAQKVLNSVTNSIDRTLDNINRPLVATDLTNIARKAAAGVGDDAAITGTTRTLDKLGNKLIKATDLKSLELIRREADDLAYTATGAGKTSAAAQAKHIRDAIDEFITPLSKQYKSIKGDYTKAKDLLELTAKGSKNAKGGTLPLINIPFGKQAVSGTKSKVAGTVASLGEPSGIKDILNYGSRAVAGGALSNAGTLEAEDEVAGNEFADILAAGGDPEQALQDTANADPYADYRDRIRALMIQDLEETGGKRLPALKSVLDAFPEAAGAEGLNSTAAGTVTDLENGLANIRQLGQDIQESDANVPIFGKLLGLNPYNTEAKTLQANVARVKQVIGKALEGGVLRKEDEVKYEKILPTLNDSDEVAQAKIDAITSDLERKLSLYRRNLGSGGGGNDLSSMFTSMTGAQQPVYSNESY